MTKENNKIGNLSKLVLGTANFGSPYGISNSSSLEKAQIMEVLSFAFDLGIRELDTAAVYGSSEDILGYFGVHDWRVCTKVPSLEGIEDRAVPSTVREYILKSMERLKIEQIDSIFAHDFRDCVGERGLRFLEGIEPFLSRAQIKKIGISVYDPHDLSELELDRFDIIQAPVNIFDHRFLKPSLGVELSKSGLELYARSLFLQGLLLMYTHERPKFFQRWNNNFKILDEYLSDNNISALSFCMGFVLSLPQVTRLIIGVNSIEQLKQVAEVSIQTQKISYEEINFSMNDLNLIDPRNWR